MHGIRFTAVVLFALIFCGKGATAQDDSLPAVHLGIVVDGPWVRNDEILNLFETEITGLLSGEFNVHCSMDEAIIADWTADGVAWVLDSLLNDPEVDLALAMGAVSSHYGGTRASLPKPVVTPWIINVELQGVPFDGVFSGRNLGLTIDALRC